LQRGETLYRCQQKYFRTIENYLSPPPPIDEKKKHFCDVFLKDDFQTFRKKFNCFL
jgi:hypothetical protein